MSRQGRSRTEEILRGAWEIAGRRCTGAASVTVVELATAPVMTAVAIGGGSVKVSVTVSAMVCALDSTSVVLLIDPTVTVPRIPVPVTVCARAGWVSMLLLKSPRNAVRPPGSRTHLPRDDQRVRPGERHRRGRRDGPAVGRRDGEGEGRGVDDRRRRGQPERLLRGRRAFKNYAAICGLAGAFKEWRCLRTAQSC